MILSAITVTPISLIWDISGAWENHGRWPAHLTYNREDFNFTIGRELGLPFDTNETLAELTLTGTMGRKTNLIVGGTFNRIEGASSGALFGNAFYR